MAKAETPVGEVILNNVRLSFADIFKPGKPQKDDDGKLVPGKFKANGLMEKGTKDTERNMAKIKKVAEEVKAAKWGKNIPKLKPDKVCLRDGDLEDWDGYANCFYISANNTNKPVVVGMKRQPVEPGDRDAPYSGCYVNMIVRLWAQDNEFGKRLNASLEGIQFLRKGEAFGAKPIDPNEKFSDVEDDEDEDGDGSTGDEEADDLI